MQKENIGDISGEKLICEVTLEENKDLERLVDMEILSKSQEQ